MEDLSLRTEFHRALDAVAPPAPWLAANVHRDLRSRVAPSPSAKRQRTPLTVTLRPNTRRVIAAVLLVLVVVAAIGASLAAYRYLHQPIPIRPHPGAVTRACGAGNVYMVDPNVGWQGTQRTNDGGRTWHDASPPAVPNWVKGGNTVCTLDSSHAWVVSGAGTGSYQPTQLVIQSTSDGGQSWQQVASIAIGYPVDWRINLSVEMDFFDEQNGWLLTEYATTPIKRTLYATSDGGRTWNAVGKAPGLGVGDLAHNCAENGMMFVSLQRGWLTWDCSRGFGDQSPAGASVIAVTNDGGRTWAPLDLRGVPTGESCTVSTPVFTHDDGILQVICSGIAPGFAAVYSTSDAGQSWTAHVLPGWFSVDLVDGSTAFYFRSENKANTLYRTTDGGNSWAVVASGLFPGSHVATYLFIDATTASANLSESPVAWWTYDGGKTWSPPGTSRAIGNVICTQPSDPGAGSAPTGVKMVSATAGWAAGARRTTDGGATWTNVSPPQVKNSTAGHGEYFLDSTHAWVAEAVGSNTACADSFVVFSTVDGGATWKKGNQVTVKLDPYFTLDGSWAMWLDFVDRDHGWLTVQATGGLQGYAPGPLYRTSDGGRSWTMVATKAAWSSSECRVIGHPVFSSPATGWLSAICGSNPPWPMAFFVTHNGGVTWTEQTLMSGLCCSPPSPRFFDAANGWLIEPNTPLLMMTSDGGATWAQHGMPQLPGYACTGKHGENMTCTDQVFDAVTFVDPDHGWALISQVPQAKGGVSQVARLERTVDGGKTWTPIKSNLLGSTADLSQATMTFVDESHGFLWTGTALVSTADGGQTWDTVQMTYR